MAHSVGVDRKNERDVAVYDCIGASRRILARGGVTRASLDSLARQLATLVAEHALFSFADFPLPAETNPMRSARYRLNPGNADIALYAAAMLPGKATIPHNHGTWAVIVAVSGEELNSIYRVTEEGATVGHVRLDLEREVAVRPGSSLALMPEDVHSIRVVGPEPALHIHMYGRPVEAVADRLGYEPGTGKIIRYGDPLSRAADTAA
jgi:predicted metal-dependent enzyme (double-stranded beta helix superfamily)